MAEKNRRGVRRSRGVDELLGEPSSVVDSLRDPARPGAEQPPSGEAGVRDDSVDPDRRSMLRLIRSGHQRHGPESAPAGELEHFARNDTMSIVGSVAHTPAMTGTSRTARRTSFTPYSSMSLFAFPNGICPASLGNPMIPNRARK